MKNHQNSFSLTLLRPLSVAAIAMLVSPIAQAELSDFSDATLWTPHISGFGPSIQNVAGGFKVNMPADSHGIYPSIDFNAGYESTFALHGDFTIDVDYTLTTWPVGNGMRLGIEIAPWFVSVRASQVWLNSNPGDEGYVFASGGMNGVVPTTDLAGTLRLARSGSTLGGYFRSGQNWVSIGSGQVDTSDFTVQLVAWSDDRFFTGQTVELGFSNPTISAEAFVLVPEPSVAALSMFIAAALLLLQPPAHAQRSRPLFPS